MALVSITPPAGIVTNGTEYSNKGRWVDGNLVRFQNGYLTPIKGWEKLSHGTITGEIISLYAYNDNAGNSVIAVGTRQKIFVIYKGSTTDITPGGFVNDASSDPLGYGAYHWGVEDYGDARSQSGLSFNSKDFSFDNWGEDLIICFAGDGKVYRWQSNSSGSADTIASVLSNAPTNNKSIVVTNERHLVTFGSGGDPRKIAWSNREDNNDWTAKATNTAGDLIIPSSGEIIGAKKYKLDTIVFTETGLSRMYYSGNPFVYGIAQAGENCRPLGMRSVVSTGDFLAWLGENSVFVYDGKVREVKCDVHDYIYDNLDYPMRAVAVGGHNSNYNEIWWFFPSDADSGYTPSRYVIWNYKDNVWSKGTGVDRGAWWDQGVLEYPIAGDGSGNILQHESTLLQNSLGLGSTKPFCTTGPIEIGQGDRLAQVNQIIPDSEANTLPGVTLSFKGKFTSNGAETDFGSFTFESDGYMDARFTARSISMKVEGDTDQDFKLGQVRVDAKPRGKR